MSDVALPSLRADLRFGLLQGRPVAEDPATGRRVALGAGGELLANALAEPTTARQVLAFLDQHGAELSPEGLRRRILHLADNGLLEGARAERIRAVAGAAEDDASGEVPLEYEPGLKHACQACGSCCSATDVGPVPERVAERILAHDWSADLPGVPTEALFRTVEHEGGSTRLTGMTNDRCVFLGPDRLCLVHKRLGAEAKPTPCRQFPYVFAHEGNRITVSLQMECRAYWKAKQAAPPPETVADDLRALLASGAPVHRVPAALAVDGTVVISRPEYVALERDLIAAVRQAEAQAQSVDDVLRAYGQAAERAVAGIIGPIEADEQGFRTLEAWRTAFPEGDWSPEQPESNFPADLERFAGEAARFAAEASRIAGERGLSWLAERFGVLQVAAGRLGRTEFPGPHEPAVVAIVADVLVSGLFGKEAIRRTDTLRAGLALVGLRAALTWAGAQARARGACRVSIHRQDVIDSMVTIGKMLRERAVLDFCNNMKSLLISLFTTNLGVLGPKSAPRLDTPGGIG